MNKTRVTIIFLLILLITLLFLLWFEKPEEEPNIKKDMSDEEIEYFLSLTRGFVVSLGEDYFIMETIDTRQFEGTPEEEIMELEEDTYERINVKVNVTEETEFIDDTYTHYVDLPEEKEGLPAFDYVKEDHIIAVYVDIEEDSFVDEVTATYISWSYYPENG